VPFENADLAVRFRLDSRFVRSPPLPDPAPGLHIPSAHFTLSVPEEGWLISLHLVEAICSAPVVDGADLQREIDAFLAMQRTWDPARRRVLQPCTAARLAGLPATVTRHVGLPGPALDDEEEALDIEVYTEQWGVYAPDRKLAIDITLLPADQRDALAGIVELPLETLEVLPKAPA
jgi:hypothetical protein